jgi:hypothetical protein
MSSTLRIIIVFAIVTAIIGAATWLYNAGGAGTLNSIERQNNEAARRADESALDYDTCRDAGRVWNFRTGKCGRAPSGSRP